MDKWQLDKQIEENVAKFTDKYFWSKFKVPAIRVEDKLMQYAGVDLQLSSDRATINFDEKAKIRGCLNRVLQYPSFEMKMTTRSGIRRSGWFYSALSTDYYAFIAVSANTDVENNLSSDGRISAIDMLWVKKQDIKDLIHEHISDEQLSTDIAKLENEDSLDSLVGLSDGKERKKYEHDKFWLTYSKRLKEKPVNLVTTRAVLESLPHSKHFVATTEKVQRI